MAISVQCEGCSATFRANIELAGKRVKCPKCGGAIQVGTASQRAADQPARPSATTLSAVTQSATTPSAEVRVSQPSAGQSPLPAHAAQPVATYEQLVATIPGAFQSDIERVTTAVSYRVATLLVAFVMILLPLIYVGLIVLAGYAVYYHAVNHTGMLQVQVGGRGYFFILLAYLAPMAIGAILVVFMIKPLFSRPVGARRQRSLTRDGEPLLFAFVDQVCQCVGAPAPRRIDVDCDVNAAASFRRGLLSFLGNDLVLTIGMPLVAGLNLRQFAGVLAHEFGHFSQGAGMRLSYIIRSIAFWFQRVVYERDQWDEWLRESAKSVDVRIGWVLYLAQLFVWLTRKILFVLMLIGYAVAGYLLRQMEFDADRYEARLAGSDTFEETARRLSLLQVAFQAAQADLGSFYAEGRLADNLPKLTQANMKQAPKKVVRQVNQSIDESKTGLFDTHPCDRDRIASAQRENAPGVFRLEQPATLLFRDFEDASRKVTWDFYRGVFGPKLKPQEMHPVDDLLRGQQEDQDDRASLVRFFQGQYWVSRPLQLSRLESFDAEQAKSGFRHLRQMRQAMLDQLDGYRDLTSRRTKYLDKASEARQVVQLVDAGIQPSPKDFTCPVSSTEARKLLRESEERISAIDGQMATWEGLAAQRLGAALGLLFCEPVAKRVQQLELHRERSRRVLPAGNKLQAAMPLFRELHIEYTKLLPLLPHLERHGEDEMFLRSLLKRMGAVCDAVNSLREPFREVPYPFDHAERDMTIARFLLKEPLIDRENLGEIYQAGESVLDKYATLTGRSMSVLTAAAEAVEDALGLDRLADPPDEDDSEDTGA